MKKKFVTIIVTLIMVLLLISCGSDVMQNETENQASEIASTDDKENGEFIELNNDGGFGETENKEEVVAEVLETEVSDYTEKQGQEISAISYEDYNISGYGHSNYIDLYESGNGYDDVKRVSIMNTGCDQYANYPDELSLDVQTIRGIKLGDSREDIIAAYGEPNKEVTYRNQNYKCDGLDPQYNMCYNFIDERFPEVFFCLSFTMDQNDQVMVISSEAILMKWYD